MMRLKSNNPVLLVGSGVLAGVLVTAIAFLVISHLPLKTWDFSQTETAEPRETSNRLQGKRSSTSSIESGGAPRSRLGGSIEETLRLDNDFDQSVALYMLLSDANEEFVLDLIDQAKDIKQLSERNEALSIIFSRYAAIDPAGAFLQAQEFQGTTRSRLYGHVFRYWSKSDLESALASAKLLNPTDRGAAARSILSTRDDLSLDRLYVLADELQNRSYMNYLASEWWKARAQENPRSAWQDAIVSTSGLGNRSNTLSTVAEVWWEREGFYVLDEINDSSVSKHNKNRIFETVLFHAAKTDLKGAIATATRLKMNPSSAFVSGLFAKWAEEDPMKVFGLADSLDPRYVFAAKHEAIQIVARESPQKAVTLLAQIGNSAGARRAAGSIAEAWAKTDPKSALEWYVGREIQPSDSVLQNIMRRVIREDVDFAFETVSAYQGDRGKLLTNCFFDLMVNSDEIAATDFLHKLSKDKRRGPAIRIGVKLALTDFGQAMDLAKTLPESNREAYYEQLIFAMSAHHRFDLFESVEDLPTPELQKYAAIQLLTWNKAEGLLTDQQVESLRSRLDANQRKRVDSAVIISDLDFLTSSESRN